MEIQNGNDNVLDDLPKVSVDPSSSVDGVWQTTHLDSMIGDLQRGNVTSSCLDTKLVLTDIILISVNVQNQLSV